MNRIKREPQNVSANYLFDGGRMEQLGPQRVLDVDSDNIDVSHATLRDQTSANMEINHQQQQQHVSMNSTN